MLTLYQIFWILQIMKERMDDSLVDINKANKHSNVKKKKKLEWNYFFAENVNGRKSKIFKMEIL